MKIRREFLITNGKEKAISEKVIKKYDMAIKRRSKREPIAYIIGKKEFWSEDFIVNNATLVPRPETELLIEKVLELNLGSGKRCLDLGTGTGILAMMAARAGAKKVVAVDVDPIVHLARQIAQSN